MTLIKSTLRAFAMSGGNSCKNERVTRAFVELYRAMEEAGLNKHPKDDKIKK